MGTRKRSRETDLLIKVASGEPLQAKSFLVRGLCESAEGLPAAAEEWDVSGLLLDGQPFTRETAAGLAVPTVPSTALKSSTYRTYSSSAR